MVNVDVRAMRGRRMKDVPGPGEAVIVARALVYESTVR
jgi:hypothetical protein